MAKVCQYKDCERGTYKEWCLWHKPRKALPKPSNPLPRHYKEIRKQGKHAKKWIETRKAWIKENKALYYTCYLCSRPLPESELTLDHVVPRSRAPELRYELDNLKPCCWPCNSKKGSSVIT